MNFKGITGHGRGRTSAGFSVLLAFLILPFAFGIFLKKVYLGGRSFVKVELSQSKIECLDSMT